MKNNILRILSVAAILALMLPAAGPAPSFAQAGSRLFPETDKTVKGKFLQYWNSHGGVTQQGFPISDELQEKSDTDGRLYTVQYFERAVFELHPENPAPNDVLLSLLGSFLYGTKYKVGAPSQQSNSTLGSVLFPQTGKRVGGKFLVYWQAHGGVAQQGYPISDEFQEKSDIDGKIYRVQYFERAVFELHPENAAPYDVLLSQLGTFRYRARHAGAQSGGAGAGRGSCGSLIPDGFYKGNYQVLISTYSSTENGIAVDASSDSNIELLVGCDNVYDGQVTTTRWTYHISAPGAEGTCSPPAGGIVTHVHGAVAKDGDQFVLSYTSTVTQGAITCTGLISGGTDLTGQTRSGEIKFSYANGVISGTDFADPADQQLIDNVQAALNRAGIGIRRTSNWRLTHQP